MNKKEFTKKIKHALSRLDLPYYDERDVKISNHYDAWVEVTLDFCLPFISIKNLIVFCEANKMCLAFDSKSKLSRYHPKELKKFRIPTKKILYG